ncbi:MAG: biotin/lipoyl-binding protein [Thioploca sp.]|nr:biotin/lipoyl-binding protein [Thioploca sp.]
MTILFIIGAVSLYEISYALAELDCIIEPHKTVEVSSATTGVLASVLVDRGEQVKKGQLLARLQSGVEEASVNLAEIQANSKVSILENRHVMS